MTPPSDEDRYVERDPEYQKAKKASAKWADRAAAALHGPRTRARTTTRNAAWANAAERRDKIEERLRAEFRAMNSSAAAAPAQAPAAPTSSERPTAALVTRRPGAATATASASSRRPAAALVPRNAVDAGSGLAIVFDVRGPGEESPLWQGRIFWEGQHVGGFSNDGRGGATNIYPAAAVEAFQRAVDASAPDVNPSALFEREGMVLIFAEAKLFDSAAAHLTLGDVVRDYARMGVPAPKPPAPQGAMGGLLAQLRAGSAARLAPAMSPARRAVITAAAAAGHEKARAPTGQAQPARGPVAGILSLSFSECEHRGDLANYLADVERSGGRVLSSQLEDDDDAYETGSADIDVADVHAFRARFKETDAFDFAHVAAWVPAAVAVPGARDGGERR